MIGGVDDIYNLSNLDFPWEEIKRLDGIGNIQSDKISGIFLRYLYYADRILQLNPKSILEIGGGFGGLCSVVFALAKYKGIEIKKYGIYDLDSVQKFQSKFLKISNIDVEYLDCSDFSKYDSSYDFVISCYAIGEFSTEVKLNYIQQVISKVPSGLLVWNCRSLDFNMPAEISDSNPETVGINELSKIKPNLNIKEGGTSVCQLHKTIEISF